MKPFKSDSSGGKNSRPFSMLSAFIFVSLKIPNACTKTAAAEIMSKVVMTCMRASGGEAWLGRKSGEGFVKLAEG